MLDISHGVDHAPGAKRLAGCACSIFQRAEMRMPSITSHHLPASFLLAMIEMTRHARKAGVDERV